MMSTGMLHVHIFTCTGEYN